VTAVVLDGKATRDEILADLQARVVALRSAGVTPGLGTVIADGFRSAGEPPSRRRELFCGLVTICAGHLYR